MKIIDLNQFKSYINSEFESKFEKLSYNKTLFNALIIQSINGIQITDLKKIREHQVLKEICNDIQKIHKKNSINFINNDQLLIKKKYEESRINTLFVIILPQIIFEGEKSFYWILNCSLNKVTLLNTSIYKVKDLLIYTINL